MQVRGATDIGGVSIFVVALLVSMVAIEDGLEDEDLGLEEHELKWYCRCWPD